MNAPLVVTIAEAGEMLRIKRTKMHELVWQGEIPSVKIGTRRVIAVEDLRAYIDSHREGGDAA